ncbi:hypothetical protein [Chryseobacterium caseinilyticum]|uniref:ATP-binding protein n=1 Tax=Chryseobacterium caseinilyticum TaxID=2771428 RepID=A0ABR8ZCQ7_9FLAO|nr:hypothetical protein [Chryseobacterium caseinilyticum]MBD8083022.1 hypothetical protein [Chryseobacterium caseinilyticum]
MHNNISTNIIRDESKSLNYIVTKNAVEIFANIFSNRNKAVNSYTIVGNYGTGKSTFLWASEQNLKKNVTYFSSDISNKNGYDFLKIIGENISISKAFSTALKCENNDHKAILNNLNAKYKITENKGKDLVIVVDEFGKFLEYINKTGNSDDLYLIQQISEWANDELKNVKFIITLHQDFSEYSSNLSNLERREWEKVKGRFKELLFNEPIEQLIFFASKTLKNLSPAKINRQNCEKLNNFIASTEFFNLNIETYADLAESIYPLDWLSINVLVNSFQRYGQNERSLFSFFNDLENNGLQYEQQYSVDQVFDYIVRNLSSEVNNYKNPHRVQWQIAFRAFDRAELIFEEKVDYTIANQIIKCVCLLNIFAKTDSLLDQNILSQYLGLVYHYPTKKVSDVVNQLLNAGIIRFFRHSKKLNFLEGTDLDIDQELANVSKEINVDFKLEEEINSLLKFPILSAKRYSYEKGTPRYFEFKILENVDGITSPKGAIDGYINLIFDEKLTAKKIKNLSKNSGANLFVLYKNTSNIHETIFNIHKLNYVLKSRNEDIVAKKILTKEIEYYIKQLEKIILNDLFVPENDNKWFFDGEDKQISSKKELNIQLSIVCEKVYYSEPIYKNELINREFISSQISTARKKLFIQLLNHGSEEGLGFEKDKFPPEKSIYVSLFEDKGIHYKNEKLGYFEFRAPQDLSWKPLWDECESFLNSSVSSRRNLGELFNILNEAPYKLKKGILDLWILSFLIIKKEDYALFHDQNGFIPYIDEGILDLIYKNPTLYSIKSYKVEGLKLNLLESYKELVQSQIESNGAKSSFLTVYGNFLRFYNSLNDYSKKTRSISAKSFNFREAIQNAKDPEEALFILFPQALGFNNINFEDNEEDFNTYIFHIKDAILEIRTAYDQLLNRIEEQILKSLECENSEFNRYKVELIERLSSIKPELLAKENSVFYRRLVSHIDDRESWLKSVADVALGKPIDKMLDSEEIILMNNVANYSRKLFEVSTLHEFRSERNRRMISLTFLNVDGNQMENKLILDEDFEEEIANPRTQVLNIIGGLGEKQRKQLLFQLLNEELINN